MYEQEYESVIGCMLYTATGAALVGGFYINTSNYVCTSPRAFYFPFSYCLHVWVPRSILTCCSMCGAIPLLYQQHKTATADIAT